MPPSPPGAGGVGWGAPTYPGTGGPPAYVPPSPVKRSGPAAWVWVLVAAAIAVPVIAIAVNAARQEDDRQDRIQEIIDEIPEATTPSQSGQDYGDNPVLDGLWDRCEGGDGGACDELFWSSPIGSDYEDFGNTCGHRYELSDVPLSCADEMG